jgi:hypothetical protein
LRQASSGAVLAAAMRMLLLCICHGFWLLCYAIVLYSLLLQLMNSCSGAYCDALLYSFVTAAAILLLPLLCVQLLLPGLIMMHDPCLWQVPVLLVCYLCAIIHDHAQLSIVTDLAAPSLDGVLLDTIIKMVYGLVCDSIVACLWLFILCSS